MNMLGLSVQHVHKSGIIIFILVMQVIIKACRVYFVIFGDSYTILLTPWMKSES